MTFTKAFQRAVVAAAAVLVASFVAATEAKAGGKKWAAEPTHILGKA